MVVPMDKDTKHIKDRNAHRKGYLEHEITKIKVEKKYTRPVPKIYYAPRINLEI